MEISTFTNEAQQKWRWQESPPELPDHNMRSLYTTQHTRLRSGVNVTSSTYHTLSLYGSKCSSSSSNVANNIVANRMMIHNYFFFAFIFYICYITNDNHFIIKVSAQVFPDHYIQQWHTVNSCNSFGCL